MIASNYHDTSTESRKTKLKIFYNKYKGWIYLVPILILMGVFTFWPLIRTVLISFDPEFNPTSQVIHYSKLSFANYKRLAGSYVADPNAAGKLIYNRSDFGNALVNTLIIVFVTVPLSTIIALAISVSLMSVKKIRGFFQTIYFLPYITNTIAIGMVFAVLFDYNSGLINQYMGLFGIKKINWLNSHALGMPEATKASMMTVALSYIVWQALPFKILIFMGALQSIDPQYYQAAKIDGTSKWRTFFRISLPLISPMLLYVIITSLIASFKTYSAIIGLFANPNLLHEMNTVVGFVYEQLADSKNYGVGAAGAVVLFLIILAMTGVNTYFAKKRVHY